MAMKLHHHTVPTSYYKCYFIKNHQFETFYKIKCSNYFCQSGKNDDVFWSPWKRRSCPNDELEPISDPGISISIQRAFFWCAGCINKLWMGCWQSAFIWARPKMKAIKRPFFLSARFQAKILFYKIVSKLAALHKIQSPMSQMRYLSHVWPL